MSEQCDLKVEKYLRGIAGIVILIGVALYHFHSPNWIWFLAFVEVNLLQSAFTNWCPLMTILRHFLFKRLFVKDFIINSADYTLDNN